MAPLDAHGHAEARDTDTDTSGSQTAVNNNMDEKPLSSLPSTKDIAQPIVTGDNPVRTVHGIQWFFAYCAIISTVLFYSLDTTIVADIQPSIIKSLGQIEKLPWIGVAINLGTIAVLPLGKAYGVFNVKRLFISCVIGFEVGSAVCGGAPNMNALIVGRAIQGVCGCGVYSGGLTYIALTTTHKERPLYLSGVIAVWGTGSILGPVIGGAFAESGAGWRWAFWINLIVAAVSAPAMLLCLPNIDPSDLPLAQKLRTQDWIGIIVLCSGGACFAMAVTFGGSVYPFSSGSEIALWVVTGVLLIAFILVTIYHPGVPAEYRLYPWHFMKQIELDILQYHLFIGSGILFMTLYYVPLIFQFTRGDGPLMSGVRLLPFICMVVFVGFLNGALMPKLGYYMPWYVFGDAMILIGSSLMGFTVDASTSTSRIYGYLVILGIGTGSYILAGIAVVQAKVSASEVNNAVGFMTLAQMMGAIVILSVAGSLYQNIVVEKIGRILPDATKAEISQLTSGRYSSVFQSLSTDVRDQVVQQVTLAIRNGFLILVVGSAIALISSFFLSRRKLY